MRVVSGSARGRKLKTPENYDIRPTTDNVKESLFNIIQFDIEGRRVLDLFAGTGQLGIEALSRGARQAVFVDQSKASLEVVQANLKKCRFTDNCELHQKTAEQFVQTARGTFDIIFLDPPYRMDILGEIIPKLLPILSPGGKIVAEHEINCNLPEKISNLELQKNYFYGKIVVSVFALTEEA
jgi:16S rRNA (guanine(966)-N(2))-methyltransferase RsmD